MYEILKDVLRFMSFSTRFSGIYVYGSDPLIGNVKSHTHIGTSLLASSLTANPK